MVPRLNISRYKAFMGRNHKNLVFQALVLALLHIPVLIEIAAICPSEVGSVIDYHSKLCILLFLFLGTVKNYAQNCLQAPAE